MVENYNEKWELKNTSNINSLLRFRKAYINDELRDLLIVRHHYHIADDIMFPDPSCLSFFTAFEQNYILKYEEEHFFFLSAVNISEGLFEFYIYCKDYEKTIAFLIEFLKSNSLYKCEFEVVLNDKGSRLKNLI